MFKPLNIPNNIKLIITDFDGIFTDGTICISDNGVLSKTISYKDIMGISVATKNNIKVAIVSGEKSHSIELLKENFSLEDVHQAIRKKEIVVSDILKKYNLSPNECVYIGDDVNDIKAMALVDYRVTPPQANYRVKQVDNIIITQANSGDGVFREVVDSILFEKNE